MANYPRSPQTLEQLSVKLQRLHASVKVIESIVEHMKHDGLTEINPTHVGQAERAVAYLDSFAVACTEAFIQAKNPGR